MELCKNVSNDGQYHVVIKYIVGYLGIYLISFVSLRDGVFQYCSSVQANLFSSRDCPCHADRMIFFMDFTVGSAFPLL